MNYISSYIVFKKCAQNILSSLDLVYDEKRVKIKDIEKILDYDIKSLSYIDKLKYDTDKYYIIMEKYFLPDNMSDSLIKRVKRYIEVYIKSNSSILSVLVLLEDKFMISKNDMFNILNSKECNCLKELISDIISSKLI